MTWRTANAGKHATGAKRGKRIRAKCFKQLYTVKMKCFINQASAKHKLIEICHLYSRACRQYINQKQICYYVLKYAQTGLPWVNKKSGIFVLSWRLGKFSISEVSEFYLRLL